MGRLGDFHGSAAHTAAKQAQQYDVQDNNYNVSALRGIIAQQQNDLPAARQFFSQALTQANDMLALTSDYLSALDAKALALAGLGEIEKARAAYRAARAINSELGIVQSATRLLGQVVGVVRFWDT